MPVKPPSIQKDKPAVKHVSRACLACRSRHLKCDGREPICTRCLKADRECNYVKSHRGGSRKKGFSRRKQSVSSTQSTTASKAMTHSSTSSSRSVTSPESPDDFVLPCVKNGRADMTKQPRCHFQCMDPQNYNKLPECMSEHGVVMHPTFNASKAEDSLNKVFDPVLLAPSLEKCYISPALTKDLDAESIVNTYYQYFHHIHPFMPKREHIMEYLDAIPYNYDLLLAMKIMGDGQATSVYSRDVETVQFLISSIVNVEKQLGKDFVSLQTLLLLAMIAHISSLHDLSMLLREALVSLTLELRINLLDRNVVPDIFLDVNGFVTEKDGDSSSKYGSHLMNTPSEDGGDDVLVELMQSRRLRNIPKDVLADTVRRTLWEVYFFDTISGTASGHTMSLLASRQIVVKYPDTPQSEFDYKGRAQACKLVNDSIQLNVAIQANKEIQSHLTHMKAAIGNWEMRLENPDIYGSPYLVNPDGHVNEGLLEAMMLVNYAQIFTHRPFSYLWRSDVSKHPKCTEEEGVTDPCPVLKNDEVDSRKIIETRKTIDSASSLVKNLLDTNPAKVTSRTPFLACGLAFSCLVHLSAYSWVESSLKEAQKNGASDSPSFQANINAEELENYTEFVKLELGAISQISRHWVLSSKLAQHIRDTLKRVSPVLYKKIQDGLPDQRPTRPVELESSISKAAPANFQTPSLAGSPAQQTGSGVPSNRALLEALRGTEGEGDISVKSPTILPPAVPITNGTSGTNAKTSVPVPDFNDSEFDVMMNDDYASLSPTSDTGCDWVDKHIFEFDDFN